MVLGIGKGDEVIVPEITFVASANVVSYVGAKPVFGIYERNGRSVYGDSAKLS